VWHITLCSIIYFWIYSHQWRRWCVRRSFHRLCRFGPALGGAQPRSCGSMLGWKTPENPTAEHARKKHLREGGRERDNKGRRTDWGEREWESVCFGCTVYSKCMHYAYVFVYNVQVTLDKWQRKSCTIDSMIDSMIDITIDSMIDSMFHKSNKVNVLYFI
jgi:hypothetical protein